MVAAIILNSSAPLTLRAYNTAATKRPKIAVIATGEERSPKATKVAGSATTISELEKPIKAINNPIPALIAAFRDIGILLISKVLKLVALRMINKIPSKNTNANAPCQPTTDATENAKNAFKPMPGASAKG